MRFLGALAVVMIHALPAAPAGGPSVEGAAKLLCRWAVPFFFIASGYFLHGREEAAGVVARRITIRIVPVYAFWLASFLTVTGSWSAAFRTGRSTFVTLLAGGPAFHLWFLPALLVGMLLHLLLSRWVGVRAQAAIALAMGLAGLLLGSYRVLLPWPGPESRAGVYFAYPLVWLGATAARRRWHSPRSVAVGLALGGLALILVESWVIDRSGGAFGRQDFVVGAALSGFGFFMLSLDTSAAFATLAPLGHVSLGIYCIHPLFLPLLYRFMSPDRLSGSVVVAVAASALAALAALAMYRIRPLRALVS